MDKFVGFLMIVLTVVLVLLLSRWIYTSVMASDMPDWLKYVILKG